MSFIFSGFTPLRALVDKAQQRSYLENIGSTAEIAFRDGVNGQHTGRVYRRKGRSHQASSPGEYPAADSGAHRATISYKVTSRQVVIGSGRSYAIYLREGTSKMARRKMSDDALKEAMVLEQGTIGRFARFARG